MHLDVFVLEPATDILRYLRSDLNTIADGTAAKKITGEMQVRERVQSIGYLRDAASMADVVLRQCARAAPDRAIHGRTNDSQNLCIFGFDHL